MPDSTPRFRLAELTGPAGRLHARDLEQSDVPTWERLVVTRPAIVLGSAQAKGDVVRSRADDAGVDVVRRRSGGGAVWLDVANTHWLDVTIGSEDVRWSSDVGAAFHWLGSMFVAALSDLGVLASAHRGGPIDRGNSRLVCFGGVGSGEITVHGRKLVGMSQRRTRSRARFQVVFYDCFDPSPMLDLLELAPADRDFIEAGLLGSAIGCDELGIDSADLHRLLRDGVLRDSVLRP